MTSSLSEGGNIWAQGSEESYGESLKCLLWAQVGWGLILRPLLHRQGGSGAAEIWSRKPFPWPGVQGCHLTGSQKGCPAEWS